VTVAPFVDVVVLVFVLVLVFVFWSVVCARDGNETSTAAPKNRVRPNRFRRDITPSITFPLACLNSIKAIYPKIGRDYRPNGRQFK